jgi:hypothetical protein
MDHSESRHVYGDKENSTINMHLKNIFSEGELKESSTIKDFLIVQKEGKREVKRKQGF